MKGPLIDISPKLSSDIAVWPGDQAFSRKVSLDTRAGDHLTLSSIETTVHVGSHADAPSHYQASGEDIASRSLEYYLGLCQVVEVDVARGERVRPPDLFKKTIKAPRVLFKTNSFPNPEVWNEDFNSLSPELIESLVKEGVQLVGIDTPSIDPQHSKKLESHQCVYKHNLAILEGLVLRDVQEGLYDLIALPLKIKDADASPVRAILLQLGALNY